MVFVDVAPDEVLSGSLCAGHLESAVEAVREDGAVVLNGVVDADHLDVLRTRMLEDLETILARPDAPYNFTRSNVQQDPPPFAPYLFRDILVNDVVIQVTKALLGPGLKNAFYSGNTALPSEARQPVHPDYPQLWSGLESATPPFALVVNVPVVDMTPENGSTEIWAGTHRDTRYSLRDGAFRIADAALDEWRARRPPVQAEVKRGGVVIRDIRLWHAGMPNRTREARPMIAMIHWISWWTHADRVPFAAGSEPYLEHPDLETVAHFVDGPIPYLTHNAAYDAKP